MASMWTIECTQLFDIRTPATLWSVISKIGCHHLQKLRLHQEFRLVSQFDPIFNVSQSLNPRQHARRIKAHDISFPKLSTYCRLFKRSSHKRTLKTSLLPISNSISRRPEVAHNVVSDVEGTGCKAYHDSLALMIFAMHFCYDQTDIRTPSSY